MKSNIWKYALLLISNKRVFIAILGAYYLTVPGVDVADVGILLLVGQVGGFVLEIPSGYASDKIGHKRALVISHVFFLLSTLAFLFASNLAMLILASVLLSGGFAFHSGTGDAFMHETLKALGREKDYTAIMGKVSAVGFAVPIALAVAVPFLVGISFKLPFVAMVVVDLVGLVAATLLINPPVPPEHVAEIGVTNFRQVLREGYRLGFFAFALFSGTVAGMLFSVEAFRSVYQSYLGMPVIWFGVLFGVGRGFASLMLAYSGKINARISTLSFYKFEIILYSALILTLGFFSSPWVVAPVFVLLNAFHWGLSKVSHSHLMEVITDSKFKATLLSTQAQIKNIVAGIAAFGVGLLAQRYSYNQGFLLAGVAFLALLLPMYFFIAARKRASQAH